MDTIREFYAALKGIEVSIPASEMMILLVVLTLSLFFRRPRFGLMLAFLGTYRWAWLVFRDDIVKVHPDFLYGFYGFGVVVITLTVLKWSFVEE